MDCALYIIICPSALVTVVPNGECKSREAPLLGVEQETSGREREKQTEITAGSESSSPAARDGRRLEEMPGDSTQVSREEGGGAAARTNYQAWSDCNQVLGIPLAIELYLFCVGRTS